MKHVSGAEDIECAHDDDIQLNIKSFYVNSLVITSVYSPERKTSGTFTLKVVENDRVFLDERLNLRNDMLIEKHTLQESRDFFFGTKWLFIHPVETTYYKKLAKSMYNINYNPKMQYNGLYNVQLL